MRDIIALGRQRMPGFSVACAPKGQCTFGDRLTEEEIDNLAKFVLVRPEASSARHA